MRYPNDENGNSLQRMEETGDDLTKSRKVDFTVVFPDNSSAETFAMHFRALGYEVAIELTETNKDLPWDVVVVKHMIPTHEDIGVFERSLQNVAAPLRGRNDGWGCFSETPSQEF